LIEAIRNIKSSRKDLREFGLLVGGILLLLALYGFFRHRPWAPHLLGIGAALVFLGAVLPGFLLPLQKAWMVLALLLGAVMSRIILSVLFYLVLTPIAVFARLIGKNFLELGFREKVDSYWVKRGPEGQGPDDSERQF
jgi:hypothetical protein